ncbi:MAG: DMT family transporter [Opitutales bacterium]
MAEPKFLRAGAYAGLVFAMLLWGSSFPGLKYALAHFDAWFLIWVRLSIAGILAALLWGRMRAVRLTRQDWPWLILMGLSEPCLYFVFELLALSYTSSAQAGIVVALLPILVALAAAVFLGERLTRRIVLGAGLAFLGAAWMSWSGRSVASEDAPNPLLGNFLELCAMVCATGYIIAVKRLSERHSALFLAGVQNWVGMVFFLPFVLIGGGWREALEGEIPPLAWGALVYLGAFVSLGAFFLYNFALHHIPANRASVFANLIPVFAVVLSMALLGEVLTLGQVVACGLILLGLVVAQEPSARGRMLSP